MFNQTSFHINTGIHISSINFISHKHILKTNTTVKQSTPKEITCKNTNIE